MDIADVRSEKSTTVRTFSFPRPLLTSFAVLNRVAPGLAARWAEQLWFTMPKRAGTRPIAVPGGEAFTVDLRGRGIAGQMWGTGPIVYLVHGWAGHSGHLTSFVAPLVERGHRVVAFDAFSHGRSAPGAYGPRSTSIPEMAAALTAVATAYGPAHAVIAHSMGGVSTALAIRDGLSVGRIAMIVPMAEAAPFVRAFATGLGMSEALHRRLVTRIERRVGAPMSDFDVPALGRRMTMPPTLVVDDRDDASTAGAGGVQIAAAWPSATLRMTAGLGHHRILRDPDVIADVLDFVKW